MQGKSHRVLKSIALLTKRATESTVGVWADKKVAINLIGADRPAANIGIALIRQGVSILRIYDPTQVVHRRHVSSLASMYQAITLAYLLAQEVGNPQTRIMGYPFCFDRVTAFPCDLAIVINADHRLHTFDSDYLHAAKTPYLSVALSPDGGRGTVIVHQAQATKLTGVSEDAKGDGVVQTNTANTIIDMPTHLVSLVGEAVDSILAGRDSTWRYAQMQSRGT